MEKILICDWLDKYAGAERVIKIISEIVQPDKIYTMVNIMSKEDLHLIGFEHRSIEESFIKNFGRKFRYALPLFPLAMKRLNKKIPPRSLVISSSHSLAKGVASEGGLHICYMQARNMKYVWEENLRYMAGARKIYKVFTRYLQKCDVASAQMPNYLIANSQYVANWIYAKYGRNSTVIYPPVEVNKFKLNLNNKDDYYVYVGRLEPYKMVNIIVKAFNENQKQLIIIGNGSELNKLKSLAQSNIKFIGFQNTEVISDCLARAKAFVMVNEEDFGIAPVESQACGTPVIALGKAGALETVVDGKTGVLFKEQTVEGLLDAVNRFTEMEKSFDPLLIREHAKKFSVENFRDKFSRFIEDKLLELS